MPIESVTAALGRRRPDSTLSQKAFRYAFILLVEEGTEPTSEEIENLNRLRQAFSGYMAEKTEYSDTLLAETELVRMLALTTSPQSGLLRGDKLEASVVLGSVEPIDVEVRLETAGGIVGVPESVVIPAGEIGGIFPIEGLQGGVASLNARIDESYETARSQRTFPRPPRTSGE